MKHIFDGVAWRKKSIEEQDAGINAGNPVAMYYRASKIIENPGFHFIASNEAPQERQELERQDLRHAFDLLRRVLASEFDLEQEVKSNNPVKSAFLQNKYRARDLLSNTLLDCSNRTHRYNFSAEESLNYLRESCALGNNMAKNILAKRFLDGEIDTIYPGASEVADQKAIAIALLVEAYVAEGVSFGWSRYDIEKDGELFAASCEAEIKRGLVKHPYSLSDQVKRGFSNIESLLESRYGDKGFTIARAVLGNVSDFIDDRSQVLQKKYGKALTNEWYKKERAPLLEAKSMVGYTLGALRRLRETECDVSSSAEYESPEGYKRVQS